jgi:hypothetical protein
VRTRLPAALAAAVLTLSLAACGGGDTDTPPDVGAEPTAELESTAPLAEPSAPPTAAAATAGGEFGAVPAPGAKLGLTPDASGNVPLKSFPDACQLLTAAQIQTILPSVTAVTTEGVPRKYIGLGTKGGVTPFPAECDYILATPSNPDADFLDWKILVDMNTLADPAFVKETFDKRKADALRNAASSKGNAFPNHYEELKGIGEEAFYDETFGIAVRSGVALLYVDARLSNYLGEEGDGLGKPGDGLPNNADAKKAARLTVAVAAAQAVAPMFAG